jgi:hypothetical protein
MSPPTGMRSHDQWCHELACQSDPDAATNSQIVAPGLPGSTQSRLFYLRSSPGERPHVHVETRSKRITRSRLTTTAMG